MGKIRMGPPPIRKLFLATDHATETRPPTDTGKLPTKPTLYFLSCFIDKYR